uniref:Globin domain-containing protein n=1 Tax=Salarias fasciatus TaxID=181472 RepID=A0A672FS36_SALFA
MISDFFFQKLKCDRLNSDVKQHGLHKAALVNLSQLFGRKAAVNLANASMLVVYPQTKTYFSHWQDLMMAGVAEAVEKIDDLVAGLQNLSELHIIYNFVPVFPQILSHNLMVVMAKQFRKDFTPEVQVSMDKFLTLVGLALSEKFR